MSVAVNGTTAKRVLTWANTVGVGIDLRRLADAALLQRLTRPLPAALPELLTLHYTWRAGSCPPAPRAPRRPGTGVHLPGFLARIDTYLTRGCRPGQHRPQLPAPALRPEHTAAPGPGVAR